MGYALLADLVVCLHLGFVLFVLFGGFLALKRPRAIWIHLPAAAWGILVEFTGWICPLTPLEQWLRTRSGGSALQGDFLSRYLLPILYPDFLPPGLQTALALFALALNLIIYGWVWRRNRAGQR